MSVEVQSMNGQLRWRTGTDLARVLQTEDFRNINRIVQDLLKIIDVKEIKRAGVRFQGMGNFADGKGRAFQRFSKVITNNEAHPAVPGWSICSMRVPCAGDRRRAGGD